jgi:pyruvate formate lyase activating enzyme
MSEHDAMLWRAMDDGAVRCELCHHKCRIAEGQWGICRVRHNVGGALKTIAYDRIIAANVDPIEKKPLYHVLPSSRSFSIATAGCNFRCGFCQNWQISQRSETDTRMPGDPVTPEQIVSLALQQDCQSISYTYTEPTIFFELAHDTAKLAHAAGLKNCFVSNGYMSRAAAETIAPYLDAINVDLKAFRDQTYRDVMKAHLDGVLDTLRWLAKSDIWLEVTTLVVPGMNDSDEELGDIASFIATELGRDTPWHVSRFHGAYEMTEIPPTPLATMELAVAAGHRAGLRYVYCGNVAEQMNQRTICPVCGAIVIDRTGYMVSRRNLTAEGTCRKCGLMMPGVWS